MSTSSGAMNSNPDERQLRIDLAATFRLAALMGWHEGVGNHFSMMVPSGGKKFLINPKWSHFARIRASDLLLLDADDRKTMDRPDAPDATAWYIHGQLHSALPHAKCILHVHSPYATTIATLMDPEIKPIDQNTARFYNRMAIDAAYAGFANDDNEGKRLVKMLGNNNRMMMGNHGVLVVADTIAAAFDDLYYLERACQTLLWAYSTGRELNVMPPDLAERTARDWDAYKDAAFTHFSELKKILNERDPSYAN